MQQNPEKKKTPSDRIPGYTTSLDLAVRKARQKQRLVSLGDVDYQRQRYAIESRVRAVLEKHEDFRPIKFHWPPNSPKTRPGCTDGWGFVELPKDKTADRAVECLQQAKLKYHRNVISAKKAGNAPTPIPDDERARMIAEQLRPNPRLDAAAAHASEELATFNAAAAMAGTSAAAAPNASNAQPRPLSSAPMSLLQSRQHVPCNSDAPWPRVVFTMAREPCFVNFQNPDGSLSQLYIYQGGHIIPVPPHPAATSTGFGAASGGTPPVASQPASTAPVRFPDRPNVLYAPGIAPTAKTLSAATTSGGATIPTVNAAATTSTLPPFSRSAPPNAKSDLVGVEGRSTSSEDEVQVKLDKDWNDW